MRPLLRYFPMDVGSASLQQFSDAYCLFVDGQRWMTYSHVTNAQMRQFAVELAVAKGVCVTTGLGLGLLQCALAQMDAVDEVVVYEKHADVIAIFDRICKANSFDQSKIKIINAPSEAIYRVTCDCLFLDHFEFEDRATIVNEVRKMSNDNFADRVWFWPAHEIYFDWIRQSDTEISPQSCDEWARSLEVKNMPSDISSDVMYFNLQTALKEVI